MRKEPKISEICFLLSTHAQNITHKQIMSKEDDDLIRTYLLSVKIN
jgi:hypothetical protein